MHGSSGDVQGRLAAAFRLHARELTHRSLPIVLVLGILLMPAYHLLDRVMAAGPWVDEPGLLTRFALFRGGVALALALQLLAVRHSRASHWSLVHAHVAVQVIALGLIALVVDFRGFDNPYFAGLLLVLGGVGLIPWSGLQAAGAGTGIILNYTLGCALFGGPYETASMVLAVSLFAGMLVISVVLSHLRHVSIREEFSSRWQLARAEERQRELADELRVQHEALQRQHEALHRQQQALIASIRQGDRLFTAATAALPGSILNGQYALHEALASGGFGVVYRATQIALERAVAVKIFKPPSAEEADRFFRRFRREGVSACRVNHENAVAVYDAGVSEAGLPYLVMELLEGSTVASRIRSHGPFRLRRTLEILADVCEVLAAAHGAGIIHRDVKPSNVFLHEQPGSADQAEVVKVLDFGIAKLLDDPDPLTVTHDDQLLGTPTHMAPERLSGGKETGRADVYSVAVMMYEMLTGRLPFDTTSKNVWATVWMHVTEPPRALDEIDPTVPHHIAALALRALDKIPEMRPNSAALAAELRRLRTELGPETASGAHRGAVRLEPADSGPLMANRAADEVALLDTCDETPPAMVSAEASAPPDGSAPPSADQNSRRT